jgi:aspartyl-tRNA(Asn)/glutamyl-tRNA(Gln) amidotransferase subunit B
MISRIRAGLPELPNDYYRKFIREYKLEPREAEALIESADLAGYFDQLAGKSDPRAAANWIMGPVKSWLNENNLDIVDFPLDKEKLHELIRITGNGMISYTAAQQKLFPALLENPGHNPETLAREMNLIQESGEEIIMKQVLEALDRYPDKIKEYHQGKKGLIGLFMGEVMKISGGRADPSVANKLLRSELEKRKK